MYGPCRGTFVAEVDRVAHGIARQSVKIFQSITLSIQQATSYMIVTIAKGDHKTYNTCSICATVLNFVYHVIPNCGTWTLFQFSTKGGKPRQYS